MPMNVALKVAIVESRKKQKHIARRADLSQTKLSAIVHGRVKPSDEEREALADVLGKPASELFSTGA